MCPDCPDCKGSGFVVKRVYRKVSFEVAWRLERLVCKTCSGKGQVSFRRAELILLHAKERARADQVDYEAKIAALKGEVF
jgi:DnaJ-class molecular chaperone